MSEKNATRVAFEMFMTDSNHAIGAGGRLVFHKDGDRYEGALDLQNPVRLDNELMHGREIQCDGVRAIEFSTVDRERPENVVVRLVQNPYEPRVSFAGSAGYRSFVYNLCAFSIAP